MGGTQLHNTGSVESGETRGKRGGGDYQTNKNNYDKL